MSDNRIDDRVEALRKTMHDRGICVIIPTYNNGGTIVDVVSRALVQCQDVIVVCDGCTDDTLERLQNIPRLMVVELPTNRGKGKALQAGFRYALKAGFAYAITLDGDGQHFPEDIPLLLKANQLHPGALIIGERQCLAEVERSKGSKFANAFSNFWFTVQTGYYLRDTQTGYRLYPLKKLRGLSCLTSRYEAELELMVWAAWHGVELVSEPVRVYYPPQNERVSHFRPGLDFGRIAALNTVLCLGAVVYGYPLRFFRWLLMICRTVYALVVFVLATMLVMTPVLYIYLRIGGITERKKYNLHRVLNFVAKFVLLYHKIPGVKYSESNPSHETYAKPAVFLCNHQSHLDLLALMAQTPKIIVLTADWVWHNPVYRYVIHHADYLPISWGLDKMLPRLKALVDKGYSVAVYPEGTRSTDCRIGRFHQGAFLIAKELNLDVVPLVLYGAGRALPKKDWKLHKWPIHLAIDRRMTTVELQACGGTLREQASWMRRYYMRRYAEIANRIERDV